MATITKRNDTYRIRVSCGYDSTGKQVMKSKTWKPAPGMTQRQIEKELRRQEVMFEEQCLSGEILQSSNIKLADFIPQYMEIMKASGILSPSTLSNYDRIIKTYIIPALGHIKLKDLKPIHVQKFINELSTNVRYDRGTTGRKDCTNQRLKPATVRRYYVTLQSILGRASKLGLIPNNPANSEKIDLPPIEQKEIQVFNKQEANQMLSALNKEPVMYQALIHLAIVTGARRSELTALQWDCVELKEKFVVIKQSNYQISGEEIKTKPTKTNKGRTISIPDYLVQLLKEHKYKQMEQRLSTGDKWHNENWVFTAWSGKPMHINTPSHWFRDFLIRENLPVRKFHALRHTSATLLLADGTNIKTVASCLGDSQLSTTNIHLHSLEESDKRAADSFESILDVQSIKKPKQA